MGDAILTTTGSVAKKIAANSVNKTRNDINALLEGETMTVKRYVGETIPTGKTVKYVSCVSPLENATWIYPSGNPTYIGVGETVADEYKGAIINAIEDTGGNGTFQYDENCYAIFEVTIEGEIPTLEKKIEALESELLKFKGGTYIAKCYVGDAVPSGDIVNLKSITVYGTEYTTHIDADGIEGSQGIQLRKESSYAMVNVTDDVAEDNQGWSINQIHAFYDGSMATEHRDDVYAVFEVIINGELNNNPVIGTYVGNDEPERFIELGFTPSAVDVCSSEGLTEFSQEYEGTILRIFCGGTAVYDNTNSIGYDCMYGEDYPIVKIVKNGFKVYSTTISDTVGIMSNSMGRHYFKAYKSNKFMVIE